MAAATSTLPPAYGPGPQGPNAPRGAPQSQGPHPPAPGPSGAPRPEEQHHKPFFYIQPSQPYLPMQWPVPMAMPVSYNPYYGYPSLGYSMPMMPNYQPNPYMETPGFVVPHTHLHLMDYRRMLNPQYYQSMAYHARRFRYQHNSPAKEMTSSEVQTEPLAATRRTSNPTSNDIQSSGVLSARSGDNNALGAHAGQLLSPDSAVQKKDDSTELDGTVPSSATGTPPKGSFVIQTEELRIECCAAPVGLQLLHAHDETAEMPRSFSQDVTLQNQVLQDEELRRPADPPELEIEVCPDVPLAGTPSADEQIPALEEFESRTVPLTAGCPEAACGEAEETRSQKDSSTTPKNFHFQAVHPPFDSEYLDELKKMESTVWSMEETLIRSPDSLIHDGLAESHSKTQTSANEATSAEMFLPREEPPADEVIAVTESPSPAEDEVEDVVVTVEGPGEEVLSEADVCPVMDVCEEAGVTELTPAVEVARAPNSQPLDNSPLQADGDKHGCETNIQHHQDTSFDSLPAYLPSASWLADFDNVYYCGSKTVPAPKKRSRPPSIAGLDIPTIRRKLDQEHKEQLAFRKPKERCKDKVDRRSLSDHECCLNRNFKENTFSPHVSKRDRLCSRCLAVRGGCVSAGPGQEARSLKRKAVPFQRQNNAVLTTCAACKSHTTRRLARKGSNPDVRGPRRDHDTDGESSENSSCRTRPKWRTAEDRRNILDLRRPHASEHNPEKCPAAVYPKLRERNCVCNEPRPVAWERLRHCPHGNAIREMDENCAAPASLRDKCRSRDRVYPTHRWQTAKSWKATKPGADDDDGGVSKNEARSQHLNKYEKSQPQSRGTRRKDTRC